MAPITDAWRLANPKTQLWPSVYHIDGEKEWYEMTFNKHILKYTVEVFGAQPDTGYPLYLGLPGGGGEIPAFAKVVVQANPLVERPMTPAEQEAQRVWRLGDNEGSWWDMAQRYYEKPVENFSGPEATLPLGADKALWSKGGGKGAVYVAVRGVSCLDDSLKPYDDWNLHSQPESFVMVERMVRNLLLPNPTELYQKTDYSKQLSQVKSLVNSNRVYLMGFSAGGDGAFQFATRLPDLFACVNAGGGHPNGVPFTNTSNLPLSLQVGEMDATFAGRARVYGGIYVDLLKRQTDLKNRGYQDRYVNRTCIVKGGDHHHWSQPDVCNGSKTIFSKVDVWFSHPEVAGSQDVMDMIIAPVPWVSQFDRKPYPNVVIWDLATRPTAPKILTATPATIWQPKQFFYWLCVRRENPAAPYQDTITAWYDKATNSVHVEKPTDYLQILLHDQMFNLSNDVNVFIGDTKIQSIRPNISTQIRDQTWQKLNDSSLVFSAAIYFEQAGGSWTVKNADTLFTAMPSGHT